MPTPMQPLQEESRQRFQEGWKLPFTPREIAAILSCMLEETGHGRYMVEFLLVTEARMEHLNLTHMGCSGPTNILSFPIQHMPGIDTPYLGSMVLAPSVVRRECLLYGQNISTHLIRLLAHSVAHLLGYEHGQDMETLSAVLESAAQVYIDDVVTQHGETP